jgi:drug/metabolite transporter (DMT)-like permease
MATTMDKGLAADGGSVVAGIGFALLANLLFATSDAIVKVLTLRYSIFQIIPVQAAVAFIPIAIMVLRDGGIGSLRVGNRRLVALRGLLAGVGTIFGFFAFAHLPLADVYAIAFCTPILVTLMSIPILGEVVRAHRWAAIIVGFIGILVMIRPGFETLGWGHLTAFLSVFTGASVVILVRTIGQREQPPVMVMAVIFGLLLTTLPVLPFVAEPIPWNDLLLFLLCGLAMGVAQFCVIAGLRRAPASVVAPMQYTMMAWALAYGALLFGDPIETLVVIGGCIVVGSSLYIMHRERRRGRTLRAHIK